jgi:cell division protein FtsW
MGGIKPPERFGSMTDLRAAMVADKKSPLMKSRRGVDGAMVVTLMLLLMAGLLTLFSATYYIAQDKGDALGEVKEQLVGIGVGLAALIFTSRVPFTFWKKPWVVLTGLGLSAVLLVLVLIPGIGVYLNGSRRWLSIAGMSIQPSELCKFAVVAFLATALSNSGDSVRSLFKGIVPLMVIPVFFFLLILEQPNLSTAMSILMVSGVMILMAGAKWKHLGLMGILGVAAGLFYAWSEPYRRERLLSFRDPFAKMSDEGYQLAQSLIAFGSGGLFGMGLGQGRQKYAYLPYPESDFIFAIVGEDFGLFGCLVVITLFVVFMFIGMRIAVTCKDKFGCLLAAGITSMIAIQAFLNMGVVVGLLPTTGLPLPFFSKGGTSVSIMMAAVGIVLNISRSGERNLR